MIDRATAEEFVSRIEQVFAHMGALGRLARERLPQDELTAFADLWREIIRELDLGVLEVIYRAHPNLRPEDMAPAHPLGAGGPQG